MRYLTFTREQIEHCAEEIEQLKDLEKYLQEKFSMEYDYLIKFSATCNLTEIQLYNESNADARIFYFDAKFNGRPVSISIESNKCGWFAMREQMERAIKHLRNYGIIIIEE